MSDSESGSSSSSEDSIVPARISPRAQQLVSDLKDVNSGVSNSDLTARLSMYHSVTRWIPVGINPLIKAKDILSISIWFRIGPTTGTHLKRGRLQHQKKENVEFELKCFDRIIELIPDGLKILEEIAEAKDGLRLFIEFINAQKGFKCTLSYDLKNDVLTPPFPVSDGKLGKSLTRGFYHKRNANRAKSINLPHNETSAPVDTQDAKKEFSLDVADSQRDETVELDDLDFPQSSYVGNQLGFDSQDEIEASAGSSVGPLTPLTYPESQYDIPNGLNISNKLSFNPNFVNFNPGPNGSFFLQPNGMTNLQLVVCRPGSAPKPRLRPGFWGLRLVEP
ncbi:hypothetical protein M378DRAFT_14026 [Amanita muscaria Koide BX008]|uniref:Uncharacterized protein n=1 Tax=Amanita muscaria (strain Koide BX008) TaxID=946122 RepID=A0A0C2SCM4_AMAMK|nr:hypothetical protein M378DRAFT_14026 [Amanita muscaria Koide BX008]